MNIIYTQSFETVSLEIKRQQESSGIQNLLWYFFLFNNFKDLDNVSMFTLSEVFALVLNGGFSQKSERQLKLMPSRLFQSKT